MDRAVFSSRWVLVIVVCGLALLVMGGLVVAAFTAANRSEPDRPFWATLLDATCDIGGSVTNPSIIGLETRALGTIKINGDGSIDFRGLPVRWRYICLTSAGSGGLEFSSRALDTIGLYNLERPVCWNWAHDKITVLLVEPNRQAFALPLNIPTVISSYATWTEYAAFSATDDFRQCSVREEAVATCLHMPGRPGNCIFGFGNRQ